MPTPPSSSNYQVGGIKVVLGGFDLGNVSSFEVDPSDLETLEHFTARSGARKLDKTIVTAKRLTFTVGLDEHEARIYRKFFMGGGAGLVVNVLTNPLAESNGTIEYVNESGQIWMYSHTKLVAKPSGSMDMGEFDDWAGMELEISALDDAGSLGTITFAA